MSLRQVIPPVHRPPGYGDASVESGCDSRTFSIGIVAHTARTTQAERLMRSVAADYISVDNGLLGCNGNHRKVWQHLADHHAANVEWLSVLEDDAIPVDIFRAQLAKALSVAPTPVVSLYLGRLRPPHLQWMIEPATRRADLTDASFIVSRQVLHAVGLAIRADQVPDMLATIDPELPIDEAIGAWIAKRRYKIGYTWPSIVEHADGETLLQHRDNQPRQAGRVAWRTGTRDHWENDYVEM